jgi:trigger factor
MTSDIQITRTKDEPGTTTLRVEAPVERVRAAQKKAAQYYAKRARLPGFRKGKVPIDVVKRRFGDAIKESVLRELVSESWEQALDKEKLEPIGEPRVQQLVFKDDAPLTFELLVEVKPDVTLDRLGGFSLTRKVEPVTDEVVEGQLQELRQQKAPWVPIDGEKPKPGDLVLVTIANLSEGGGDEGKPYQMILGSGQALPEVEEKIMTLAPGDTADTTIRFPEDFADEAKRGLTMNTRISLQEAKRLQLPELNDDFAREVGDFDSLEELRKAARQDLESAASREADAGVRRQLMEQIIAANEVPAPRSLVDKLIAAYARAYEVGDDQSEKFTAEFGPVAEGQVKRDLVIEQVALQESLAATEEEIDQRVEEIARSRSMDPGKVYASLQKENRLRELERSITDDKVFRFLLEQSTITES